MLAKWHRIFVYMIIIGSKLWSRWWFIKILPILKYNDNNCISIHIPMKFQKTIFAILLADFVNIGGKPHIKIVWGKKVQFQMVSLINGPMIFLFIVRKSMLDFHKRIDLNMKGILVELLLPPQISSTHTHTSHFPMRLMRICINMLNHFNQMFQGRIMLITMTALINRTLMTRLNLNGSNRIQCILSYIKNIVNFETSTMQNIS